MSGNEERTKPEVAPEGEADAEPTPVDHGTDAAADEAPEDAEAPKTDAADPSADTKEGAAPDPEPEPEPDPVAELTAQLEKKQNQLLRVAADYDNFKKRSRRDAQEAALRARSELLQDLLPVIDDVERALEHVSGADDAEADAASLRQGVEMVLTKFKTTMERYELKSIDPLGEPFDPNFHEAMMEQETDEHPPGVVTNVYQRGYLLGERLVRPAMVIVSKAATAKEPAAEEPAPEEPRADDAGNGDGVEERGDE